MNKKRIIVILIIIAVCIGINYMFTTNNRMIQGNSRISLVEQSDTEFKLENDAHLKNKPIFSSKTKGTISKGTQVRVLQELNKWIEITDGTNAGWVVKQNVVTIETDLPNEPITNEPTANVVENQTTVNNQNTVTNEVVPEVPGTSNVGKKGVVNVDTARVRETPNGKMVGLVDLNDKVEILAEEGDWYKVNVDEFQNCYIAKRLVTIK